MVVRRSGGAEAILARVVTSADGMFRATISLRQPMTIVARTEADVESEAVTIAVRPRMSVKVTKTAAFADASVRITVDPRGANGTARVTVKRNGKTVQKTRAQIRRGRATKVIVAPTRPAASAL